MVSEEHRTGLYVTVPLYFVLIACCAYWGQTKQRRMQADGVSDKLSSHYLGGRALGPLLTAGTIFASFYSGYTVVGIPNEAFDRNGWMAFRWVAAGFSIITGYFGTGLRLRKAALVRNHKTPVDFITDRFQSQVLRYTILFLQVIPALIYITAQVVALRGTLNTIFGLDQDSYFPVLIIMLLTLLFEWVGGINCVALTDCVQGCIMLVAYRTYAAQDLFSLKCAYIGLSGGMWFMMMVGVFIGTMGVQILADEEDEVTNAFTAVLEKVMDLGGLAKGIGLIAVTASLAAIMSTADSLLIAISQLVTEEIVYPLCPEAAPSDMAWVGRAISFAAASLATIMGLAWDDGITDLATINFQLSLQSVFIFLVGLFATNKTDFHPWCLATGAIVSTIYVFVLYFGYIRPNDDSVPINAGVSGFALQLVISFSLEGFRRQFMASDEFGTEEDQRDLIFPYRPDWDIPRRARFGACALTPNLVWKMMDGVNEPLTKPWFCALMFFTISYMTPIVPAGLPEVVADIPFINGLPWWVWKMIVSGIVPCGLLLLALSQMPSKYSSADNAKDVDPDALELTREELGFRSVYDQKNDLVAQRRRDVLLNLGVLPAEIEEIAEDTDKLIATTTVESL